MKKLTIAVLLFASVQMFAAEHFIARTLEPAAKLASYPVRHPIKTSKGLAKAVAVTVKAVF